MSDAGAERRKRNRPPYQRLSDDERKAAIAQRSETVRQRSELYRSIRDALAAFSSLPRPQDAAHLAKLYEKHNKVRVSDWLPRASKWIREFEDAWNHENDA